MKIRYGIIGTGMMGCEHIRNLVRIDAAEIIAIADPNPEPRAWACKPAVPIALRRYMQITESYWPGMILMRL